MSMILSWAQEAKAYRLKANDEISLTIFREPDLAATEKLTITGEVSFHLIGSIQLLGLTIGEAEKLVTEKYDADYLVSPSLSINVVNAADELISVLGAVNNPGQQNIPVNETLDLATAIESAGGLAAHADSERIELKRGDETQTFRLADLNSANAPQVVLNHGDRVNVAASPFANKTVTILGEVNAPGSFPFPISGQMSLDLLIASSNGLTKIADPGRITIKRNGKIYSGTLGRQQGLAPGDLVTIPPSRFAGKSLTFSGKVARPGDIPFPLNGKLDILGAVNLAGGFDRLANKKKVTLVRVINGKEQSFTLNCEKMLDGEQASTPLQPGDRIFVKERVF
ncbi:MAG: SLBB domain-containing protein [Akkermansiaceae bacterium]|nr:SLBB domain-containing protein [Akkermansiaceae bacterium]